MNAVNLIQQSQVPFVETEVHPVHIKNILGRDIPQGLKMYDLPPNDYIEFLQKMGMDMAYLHVPWKLGRQEVLGNDGLQHYVDGIIKSPSDMDKFYEPDLGNIRKRLDQMCNALDKTNIGIVYNIYNTPFIVTTAVGYEDYYMNLIQKPVFIDELFKRVDEVVTRQLNIVLEYPVDMVLLTNILCMNTGPLMSREIMEKYELPYLKRHVNAVKARDIKVAYHCDGDNSTLCRDYIDMGIHALQAIEPCGNQDIYELKNNYKRQLCLWGNIDVSLLRDGTEEQIIADVEKHIKKLNCGGGYICSSSHDINEMIPTENLLTMIKAIVNT